MMKFLQEKLFKKLLVIALVMMGGVMWGQTAYTLNHAFGGASGVPTGIQVVSYNGSTSCSTSSNGANAVTTLVLKAMPGYQFTITSVTGTGVRSNAGANMFQFQLVNGSSTVNGTDTSVGASSSCSGGGTISPLSFAANEQVVTENNTVSIKIARHPNGTSGGGYSHVKTLAIQGIVSPTLPQFNLQGSSLAFADVCLEQPENGYFTFTGDNFSTNATVQVGALAGFSYSLTQEGTYEETLTIPNYNGEEITVWVNFTPTAMSNYSGNIPLSALAPDEEAELDIPVTGQGSLPDSPVADAQDFCGAATVADLLPVSPEADTFTEDFSSEAGTGVNANEDIAFSLGTWHFKNIAVADSQELIFYSTVPANAHILTPAFNGIQSITFDGLSQGAGVSNLKVIKVIDGAETVVTTVELQPGSIGDPSTYDSYTVDINDASSNIQIKFVSSDVPAESGYYEIIKNLNFTGYPEYTYNWYDAETGGTALASDAVLATGTYYVSQTVGTCESLRTAVEVTANDIPAAPTANAQLFCGSATVADMEATVTGTPQWYDVETGGTALADDTALATGTYYVSQIVNGCESTRTTVAITVNPIPAAPTAANVQDFCGTTTLADVVVTGSNITWYDAPTGGSAVANNTVLTEGTSLYYAAQTVDGCESIERVTVAVAVTITPAPQVENLMLCGASTVADLTVISGTNVQWYNAATGGTPLAVDAAVTAGTYYASQTVNGCESSRAAVTVTINSIPVVPTADAQSFCGSATVADLTATGTSVFQTIFNDTFNNLNNWNAINLLGNTVWATSSNGNPANAPYVAINGFNVNNEDWLVSNPIAISADAIGATLKFITASNYSGPNLQVFYTTNYTGDVNTTDWQTLSPTLSSGGWAWVNSGDLDISDAVGSNLVVGFKYTSSAVTNGAKAWEIDNFQVIAEYQYLNWYDMGGNALTDTDALSTGTYNVTQTINGCESAPTAVAITVNPIPAAPVAEAQMFCGAATIADIAVTMEGTATWYADADATIQLPTDVSIATTTYYVSQTINGCEGEVAAVAVTVNPIPAAPVAEAQMFCGLTTVADLVATGENLMWYDVETGGVALLDGLVVTTGTYYVSQTVNGCVSPRTMVEVTVNEIPVAPIADAQMFCGTATVADLAVNMGENVMWYDVATGGTALATDAALATGTYYVSQTVNNCESPRAMVAVTVNEIPAAPIANAQLFCGSAIVAEIAVTTGENVMWYNVATGGTALAANTALATGTYYVSQTVNGCESERTAVEIAVNPIPAAPTADAMLFCGSATAAELTATTVGAPIWYADATTTTTLAVDAELSTGLYYVSQIVGGCESTRTAVSVTVNEIPAAPVAEAQLFCGSAVASELMATTVGAPIWYADETTTTPLAANAELATGAYYVSQIVNGCESARTMVEVTVNEIPVAPTADDFTFCGSATVADLSVISGEMPMWYATETGGEALAMNAALATGMYYVSQTVNGCESPRAMVEVTVNEIPAAPTAEGLQTFCNAATVSNIAVTGENITWYDALVGGSMVDGDMPLTEGTSVYYASQTVNGCEGARVAVAVVLNVTPAPASADFAFCNAATVADLNVTTTGTPQWYDVEVDGEPLAMDAALATGTYYLTQTINGCESARVAVNVVVTVVASPVGEATQEFVAGETIADLEVEGNNVVWYSDAELTVMIETTTVLVDGTTYYAVSNDGDCASEVLAVTVEEVLKTDVVTDTKFTHYPNPVVDVLNIEFKENITSVVVYNVLGQMVMERTVNATNVQVNMSTLSAGTYIVRAATDNKSTSFKVVKN